MEKSKIKSGYIKKGKNEKMKCKYKSIVMEI